MSVATMRRCATRPRPCSRCASPGSSPITSALTRGAASSSCSRFCGEDVDRLVVGARLELDAHVDLDGGREQALVRVGDDEAQLTPAAATRRPTSSCSSRQDDAFRGRVDRCSAETPSASPRRIARSGATGSSTGFCEKS